MNSCFEGRHTRHVPRYGVVGGEERVGEGIDVQQEEEEEEEETQGVHVGKEMLKKKN